MVVNSLPTKNWFDRQFRGRDLRVKRRCHPGGQKFEELLGECESLEKLGETQKNTYFPRFWKAIAPFWQLLKSRKRMNETQVKKIIF